MTGTIATTMMQQLRDIKRRLNRVERRVGQRYEPPPPPSPNILSTEDLDTVVEEGVYFQPLNANATPGRNYPVDTAGLLQVWEGEEVGSGFIYQRYQEHAGTTGDGEGRLFWRCRYNGSWSTWSQAQRVGDVPVITRYSYVNDEFFTPAAGVAFGAGGLTMTADVGEDGSAQVVWSGELLHVPYISGSGESASFGDVTEHLPAAHAAVQMQHSVNVGLGVMTTGGRVTMRWGSFNSTGTTTLWLSCAYSVPGGP